MIPPLDCTHDPSACSWVESANLEQADFPIQNLPFGAFRSGARTDNSIGVAIGDAILDLKTATEAGCFASLGSTVEAACLADSLNELMALDARLRLRLRSHLFEMLSLSAPSAVREIVSKYLVRSSDVVMQIPAQIGDYTDFYASIFHARNVGSLFRPDSPLLPNYKWVPIGYHGRASSIVVSGSTIRRPSGQLAPRTGGSPIFEPSRAMDYELEVGAFVAGGNSLGEAIPITNAEEYLFGFCLVNDWSARDIQSWEYQPLGPFLSKSFATSLSPWVVTAEALVPYRCEAMRRPQGDPQPLGYLDTEETRKQGGIDITVEVSLSTDRMRKDKLLPVRLSRGSSQDLYWTFAQLIAHHSSNGCNLRPGDLLASGTVSGAEFGSLGCLLEMTSRGARPLELPSGERRAFLEDGDEIILRGWCAAPGKARIGFGECRGRVESA